LDFRFCRTHVVSLSSPFFGFPLGGFGYPVYPFGSDWMGGYGVARSNEAISQLAAEVNRLSAELTEMREEERRRESEREQRQAPPQSPEASRRNGSSTPAAPESTTPTTLLVCTSALIQRRCHGRCTARL
jgi:hypothetical protein